MKPGRWAKVPRLVTTRMNNVTIEKEREKAQSEKYFRSVEAETEYPATVSLFTFLLQMNLKHTMVGLTF